MKVIIAGSRKGCPQKVIESGINCSGFDITVVISGGAKGIDSQGETWARENRIPIIRMPAEWEKFGKSAGYKRNAQMSEQADAVILFWDGSSPGTRHMRDIAIKKGLPIKVYTI